MKEEVLDPGREEMQKIIDELTEENREIRREYEKKMEVVEMSLSVYEEGERGKEKEVERMLGRIEEEYLGEVVRLKKKK